MPAVKTEKAKQQASTQHVRRENPKSGEAAAIREPQPTRTSELRQGKYQNQPEPQQAYRNALKETLRYTCKVFDQLNP